MNYRSIHKSKTTKLLEKNVKVNHHDFKLDNGFLSRTQKAQVTKKRDKLGFIKILKVLCFKRHYQKSLKDNPQNGGT